MESTKLLIAWLEEHGNDDSQRTRDYSEYLRLRAGKGDPLAISYLEGNNPCHGITLDRAGNMYMER